MKKFGNSLKLILKFSFAFFVIGYMVYSGHLDIKTVRHGFSHGSLIALCFGLIICSTVCAFTRWRLLLQGQDLKFSAAEILRYGMIGAFFNTTMPGAVSGDLIKAWYMVANHKQYKKTPILTSILLDRVMGVFGLILLSSLALFCNWRGIWLVPKLQEIAILVSLLAAGVFIFFLYILFSTTAPLAYLRRRMNILERYKLGALLLRLYDAWLEYRKHPLILLKAMALSMIAHLFVMMVVIYCAYAVGENKLEIYQYFLLAPLGLLMTAVPIAPAGLGVGHVAFGALFALLGSQLGAEIFTLLVSIQICFSLLGVFFYISGAKLKPQDMQSA